MEGFMTEINRSELRKIIMTILYQISVYDSNKIKYDVKDVIKESLKVENEFVNEIVYGVLKNKTKIDEMANTYLKDWSIDRLGKTDGAILRMGIYEMLYTDTPDVVCINEAILLAKEYSDEKVKNMINAVLDGIMKNKDVLG
jgi:N utilization substance protein B